MKKIFFMMAMASVMAISCTKDGDDKKDSGDDKTPTEQVSRVFDDFEDGIVTWNSGFSASFDVVDNPSKTGINTSAKVGKITHKGAQWEWLWRTPFGQEADGTAEVEYVTFSEEGYVVKVDVLSPKAGSTIYLKFEASSAEAIEIQNVKTTKANEWETLEYDYEPYSPVDGEYLKFTICFADTTTENEATYIDNIRICQE